MRDSQFPDWCVSLVLESLAGFLSDPLAGLVSGVLPSSVASPLPNLVPDSHPEFLPWFSCGSRFRSSWEILSRRSCELRFRLSVALVYSLLLEDCSSVELKDTLDCPVNKGV